MFIPNIYTYECLSHIYTHKHVYTKYTHTYEC